MASILGSSDITLKFKEILKSNQILYPVSEVIVKDSGLQGEHMCSITHYVTIKFENPKLEELHLFMKSMTTNPSQTVLVEEARMFEKEVSFFAKYLPQAREFCKKMGQEDLMDIYPKCYYADETSIVFENLVVGKGYVLLNKEEQQDFDSASVALNTLAKHHAISHAFVKSIGGQEELFRRFPDLDFEAYKTKTAQSMMEPAIENGIKTNISILEKCNLDGKEEAISVLKAQQGKTYSMILEPLERDRTDGNFQILNHGDYWTNNMLFLKDKETNNITGHIAVDFQLLRYCSPSVDLSYYLFTSVKTPVRVSRFEELFSGYLETLNKVSNELGHPINMIYEQLYADYCKNFKFGYWIGTFMSSGAGYAVLKDCDPNESLDFTELVERWVARNPEKCAENAPQIIEIVKEFQRFSVI